MIAILTEESSVFAASHLARAMKANLYVILPRYNDILDGGVNGIFWKDNNLITAKNIIIIGYAALKKIASSIDCFETIAFIASESTICRERKWVNNFLSRNKIVTYAMPDMIPFLGVEIIPAYQTMIINPIPRVNNNILTVAHSPRNGEKSKVKGTDYINEIVRGLKMKHQFNYIFIKNYPHKECLKLKAQSDIFIDQLIYGNPDVPQQRWGEEITYEGGLGKSGIEAMLLGCCVITGGRKPDTERYFPPPPIIWTDYDNFKDHLDALIKDKDLISLCKRGQQKWAETYLNPEFVSHHITRHIWER